MVVTTIVGMVAGIIDKPVAIIGGIPSLEPTFGVAFSHIPDVFNYDMLLVIFTFLFVSFFDASGTLIAVANQAGIMKDNKIPRVSQAPSGGCRCFSWSSNLCVMRVHML